MKIAMAEKVKQYSKLSIEFFTFILCTLFSAAWCFAGGAQVSVIFSSDIEPYQHAWEGYKEIFDEKKLPLLVSEYNLQEDEPSVITHKIMQGDNDIVFTLGSKATRLAKEEIRGIPIVFSMVLNPEAIINSHVTGVSLNIPVKEKLKYIRKILPDVKRIGAIYYSQSIPAYEEISEACKEMGFQIIGRKIDLERKFPMALKDIARRIDCFLMIPDTSIYFAESIKHLLLEGLRKGFAVIGLSSTYTKAGALISFESDYNELGRQAGEITIKILDGKKPVDIKPSSPRKIRFSLNLSVAEILGIRIPANIIQEASEVFGR